MKIVQLELLEDSILAGIDAMALVEKPAIEEGFFAFAAEKFAETYTDYPQAAVDAAKQGIKRNEANNNKCATQVGKVRAQQLANREPVSLDTVRRMRSFLIRQKDNYELQRDRKAYDECGYISYLLWGGEAALPWAEKILRQAGEEFAGDYKSNRGKEVFLLSCSATKLEEAAPARELYASPLFKKSLDYAERHCTLDDNIAILSAKYYLVPLDTVIKPYDVTLNDMTREQRKMWANTTFIKILEKYDMQKDKFVFLAGEAYTEFLIPKFKYKVNLLEGKKIGERMQWLDKYYICFNDDNYAYDLIKKAIFEGLEDACQPGYEAIGLKTKGGRKVPNCVPKTALELEVATLPDYTQEITGSIGVNEGATYGFATVEDQQMLIGPAMVPGKLIPRKDENGDVYYVYFTKDTIKKLAYKAMKDKIIDRVNIEHNSGELVDDVYLVESWIVENPQTDKAREYGLNPVEGTWMTMYKVDNLDVWEGYVKPGLVKGFSIEGYFAEQTITQ